jgi:hypothetical protein
MLYAFIITLVRATCTAHVILLDLIIVMVFGAEYKFFGSPLCSFLQPPVMSSLLGSNILTLFSNTPSN